MAAQSAWRTNHSSGNGPRWGQNTTTSNQTQQRPASNGDAINVTAPTATGAFPSLGNRAAHSAGLNEEDSIQRDRTLHLLIGLIGHTVVVTTRSGSKHIGILQTTSAPDSNPANGTGVVLSVSQQIHPDNHLGPIQKVLIIKGEDVAGIAAREVGLDVQPTMSHAERLGFRTDTQISNSTETFDQRSLQKWVGDAETDMALESTGGTTGNALGGWDQFAANEAKFGIKSNYEETMYTTKLDKSGKDYKDRERKADQLAKEIMSSAASNSHIAEERNIVDAEGATAQTEEDKYGAVVRGTNAYVPPGARRAAAAAAAATASASATARMNGANTVEGDRADSMSSSATPAIVTTAPSNSAAIPATSGQKDEKGNADKQQNKDATGDFRQFVSQERERAERKKAALAKQEKDNKLADLRNWSDKFKLSFPVPKDLAGASQTHQGNAKDVEEAPQASETPRDPSLQKSLSPTPANAQKTANSSDNGGSASARHSPTNGGIVSSAGQVDSGNSAGRAPSATSSVNPAPSRLAETKAMLAKMTIPAIPPFDATKTRVRQAGLNENVAGTSKEASNNVAGPSKDAASSKSSFKMSAKASSFKPFNPNAATFTPGVPTNNAAPRPSQDLSFAMSPPPVVRSETPLNPFFGNRIIKKPTQPLHVQKEFSPFKTGKVPDPSTVGSTWDFTGKPYRDLFHVIPADDGASTSQQTPHTSHPNPNQPVGVTPGTGVTLGGNGLPTGVHLPPPHMVGQQSVPPHLAGLPLHQAHLPHGAPHQVQQNLSGAPHLGQHNQVGQPSLNQPMYMQYQPYRLQHGQQPMQHLGASPYMNPQFMSQMPFSPPMPPAGAPGGMYSPQMQNMMSVPGAGGPPGAHPHMRGQAGGPPHMQGGKGQHPPHMYYQQGTGQPMQGMPYGQPFPPSAGPSPVIRHQQQHHQHHPQHHHISQQYQNHNPYGIPTLQQHGGNTHSHQQQQSIPSSASVQTSLSSAPTPQTAPTSGNVSEAGSATPMSGQGTNN
jgi:LsmAD domain/Ataxin 2 SM domain